MKRFYTLILSSLISTASYAGTNISLVGGSNYEAGDNSYTTLRFEHASGWQYGSNFFFFDVSRPASKNTFIYGEWHTGLSLSKISGQPIHFGPISDVLLTGEFNFNGSGTRVYLYGMGVKLNIPTFAFAKLNAYVRRNPAAPGETFQISTAWNRPFTLSKRLKMYFSGFVDYAGAQGQFRPNLLAEPAIMFDLGNLLHCKSGRVFIGIQYVYWRNKLGIKGTTESTPEWKIQWNIA